MMLARTDVGTATAPTVVVPGWLPLHIERHVVRTVAESDAPMVVGAVIAAPRRGVRGGGAQLTEKWALGGPVDCARRQGCAGSLPQPPSGDAAETHAEGLTRGTAQLRLKAVQISIITHRPAAAPTEADVKLSGVTIG
jgi:hypothetical protein